MLKKGDGAQGSGGAATASMRREGGAAHGCAHTCGLGKGEAAGGRTVLRLPRMPAASCMATLGAGWPILAQAQTASMVRRLTALTHAASYGPVRPGLCKQASERFRNITTVLSQPGARMQARMLDWQMAANGRGHCLQAPPGPQSHPRRPTPPLQQHQALSASRTCMHACSCALPGLLTCGCADPQVGEGCPCPRSDAW